MCIPYFSGMEASSGPIKGYDEEEIVISDIPLLIETGAQKDFDLIVLVYAPPWLQLERLKMRNGYSDKEPASGLITASHRPEVPYADIIIDNSYSVEKTQERLMSYGRT